MDKEFELGKEQYLEAIDYIKKAHDGQFRTFSMCPYYVHPIRVAALVAKYKYSHKIDELILAALCHDVVEDTAIGLDEIEQKYGVLVKNLVEELTSDRDEQHRLGKTIYLSRKMEAMSSWGLVIKLCDRFDNVMDFAYAPEKFISKYALETSSILQHIKASRDLSETHLRIIEDIEKTVGIYWHAGQ